MHDITAIRGLLLLAATGIAALLLASCDGPESPQSKAEYATLQAAELQGREAPLQGPSLREIHGRVVLGAPALGGGNVWILLRTEAEPRYKQIPADARYSVPEDLIQQLEASGRVTPEVAKQLRKGGA